MAQSKLKKRGSGIDFQITSMKYLVGIDAVKLHQNPDLTEINNLTEELDKHLLIIAPKIKLKFSDIHQVFRTSALLIIQRSMSAALITNDVMPIIDQEAYEEILEEWCYNPEPLELEYDNFMPLQFSQAA